MTEKLKNNNAEENHQEKIQIPVIQITMEGRRTILDQDGKIVEQAQELREASWLATTIPPEPLRVKKSIEVNGLTSQVKASVGKKTRRKRKPNLSS